MTDLLQLSAIRRFYRAYLDKYLVFRILKQIVLRSYRTTLHLSNVIIYFYRYQSWWSKNLYYRILRNILVLLYPYHQYQSWWCKRLYYRLSNLELNAKKPLLSPYIKYRLTPMASFLEVYSCNRIVIDTGSRISVPGPKILGNYPVNTVWPGQVFLKTPILEIVEIEQSTVIGKSDFILWDKIAIHADLFDHVRDLTFEEVHGIALIKPKKGTIQLRLPYRVGMLEIPCAVSLLGGCTGNYVHWLTETLPKLLILDSLPQYRELPLLVDEGLHPNIIESLNLFNFYKHPIITVNRWEVVTVEKNLIISPPAYTPFEYRSSLKGGTPEITFDHTTYAPLAMQLMRKAAVNVTGHTSKTYSKQLFLRRRSQQRHLLNVNQVEKLLVDKGFEVIEPDSLSFSDQIAVFRNAEVIVSQAGAALGNMIFSPAGCKVIALSAYSDHTNYYYFSNLAGVLGHNLSYVLGTMENSQGDHPAHGDISIDTAVLLEALQ